MGWGRSRTNSAEEEQKVTARMLEAGECRGEQPPLRADPAGAVGSPTCYEEAMARAFGGDTALHPTHPRFIRADPSGGVSGAW